MQFNSYSYLILLLPATLIYWNLPQVARRWYLLVLSIAFYATWNPVYAPLPLLVCVIAWICARGITTSPDRSGVWLRVGVVVVLALLAFFKYSGFLVGALNSLLVSFAANPVSTAWKLALPLGISFYTFEAISYLLDTKQGRVKKTDFVDLSLFVTFLPHLIAGPIVRVRELVPQFKLKQEFSSELLISGLDRLILGLAMKNLLANNLSSFIDQGFLPASAETNTMVDNWFLALAFGLQIYFDFAAYSHMAIGTARLVGIRLPENFNFPYHAGTFPEFWNRWHMTLSRWIRDYLFFPLNAKYQGAVIPLYVSLIAIMGLVGLWHGAGWGFILWGLLHGAYLVLNRIWDRLVETRFPAWKGAVWARWTWHAVTLFGVFLAWVPFRASTLQQTGTMLQSMLFRPAFSINYSINYYLITLLFALFCLIEPWLWRTMERVDLSFTNGNRKPWNDLVIRPILYASGLFLFFIFDALDVQFIYFQF